MEDCTESGTRQLEASRRDGEYDAVIIGAGPNGLSAGIVLAAAGARTLILERNPTVGGGARTAELTAPGFRHDICSAIHPLGVGSPFFRRLPLEHYGLEWIHPPVLAAHPLDGGQAAALYRSVEETAAGLGSDAPRYRDLLSPFMNEPERLFRHLLAPLRPKIPSLGLLRFGLRGLLPVETAANRWFGTEPARALLAGMGAHSILALDQAGTSAFALTLMIAGHAYGWPMPRGGSQAIADALAAYFQALGGEIDAGAEVRRIDDLPPSRTIIFDTTPAQMLAIAGDRIGGLYRRQARRYRYGPGVFKIDYALRGPINWLAEACKRAGTVHVGGTLEEVAASERAVLAGRNPASPFVLVAQPSVFDDSRAPGDNHVAWVYCHAPHGSTVDMTAAIERQIERFAPGFRSLIIARHTMNSVDFEHYNPNYIGGDISAGSNHLTQLIARPTWNWNPYATSDSQIFLCSAATPPGGGVHGMAGYHAARAVLKRLRAT